MADDIIPNGRSSIAQEFTGLPIADLIGSPLMAAADANGLMAKRQTQFLLDTCFDKGKDEQMLSPIMIKMNLRRAVLVFDKDGKPATSYIDTTIELPLLTIIPLNSLGVDSVAVDFEMEVKSSRSEDLKQDSDTNAKASAALSAKAGWGPFSVSITGKVSYESKDSKTHNTHYENSNSAKYKVSVHAGQLPMPKGVNLIIDAYSKSIQPIEHSAQG